MSDVAWEPRDHFIDKSGRRVVAGDWIVYGHALGRCAGLRFGKVLSIASRVDVWDRVEWRIEVQGVDDDGSWRSKGPRLCARGRLGFPSRIVRLGVEDIPEGIRTLVEGY